MRIWPIDSIKKGIITTKFPKGKNETVSPWSTLPIRRESDTEQADCPTNAILNGLVNLESCISCGLCDPEFTPSLRTDNYKVYRKEKVIRKSLKIYMIDSGTCGACNTELMAIANPNYDSSRLGIFFTNTPKQADAIAIMGVYTEGMNESIKAAMNAMARPGIILLFGACSISGGIIGSGLKNMVDPDLIIGGCPPDPFVILEALQKVRGR